jgi:hypothetical protein
MNGIMGLAWIMDIDELWGGGGGVLPCNNLAGVSSKVELLERSTMEGPFLSSSPLEIFRNL